MRSLPGKTEVQNWLMGLFRDPFVKILVKNSHLTKTQLETILIDILAENISEKKIVYEKKAKLRLIKKGVSRGSFNRTLKQARTNIINSIYTIILLGYLGVLDNPRIEPYLEIANKIHAYFDANKKLWTKRGANQEHIKILSMLQEEIERGLEQLSEPIRLSDHL
jgi:hypothetical protein